MPGKSFAALLDDIERGALDSSTNLPDLLRRCIALGGRAHSERLVEWARHELMGYGPDVDLPEYRRTSSLLFLDGATIGGLIRGQQVPLTMIPPDVRAAVHERNENVQIRQSIAEVADVVASLRARGRSTVDLSPPLAPQLVALMNAHLHDAERRSDPFPSPFPMPARQTVERVYWSVGVNTFAGILDAVRTALVQLVVEMRAATPDADAQPALEAAAQAVEVAIYGKARVKQVVVNQIGANSSGAAAGEGSVAVGGGEPESRPRRWMWWAAGVATLVAAGAGVAAFFFH